MGVVKIQRFGSGSIATHSVGAALLRGEWKAAVNLILDPREGDILPLTLLLSLRLLFSMGKFRYQYKKYCATSFMSLNLSF